MVKARTHIKKTTFIRKKLNESRFFSHYLLSFGLLHQLQNSFYINSECSHDSLNFHANHSHLKTEGLYPYDIRNMDEAQRKIEDYIRFYNQHRPQRKLNNLPCLAVHDGAKATASKAQDKKHLFTNYLFCADLSSAVKSFRL
ncbi:IS3 family transposase [Paenibacillus etheri]|uniref:Integrase catalytic domain-containing protein n=1 Tax=Paenibacillus etheri TaxID=1306852 RepID=A0A0W1B4Y7_9BACL|nr:IS3 family transposase [Paenibacillus etheri]KTD88646.1 hypothetical protein UQ64_04850 [Paenibacillus etheri]